MQQTLIFLVDHITANEDIETGEFLPTNFDVCVDEFCEACLTDECVVISKSVFPVQDKVFCVIDYRQMTPEEKNMYAKYKAEKSGIITKIDNVRDIKFNA